MMHINRMGCPSAARALLPCSPPATTAVRGLLLYCVRQRNNNKRNVFAAAAAASLFVFIISAAMLWRVANSEASEANSLRSTSTKYSAPTVSLLHHLTERLLPGTDASAHMLLSN